MLLDVDAKDEEESIAVLLLLPSDETTLLILEPSVGEVSDVGLVVESESMEKVAQNLSFFRKTRQKFC